MAKVFLSYARADHSRVAGLAAALEQAGHEVWWDRRIGGGAEFAREIEMALGSADVVIVAWSAHSVTSHWVRDEAADGRDTGRLLPVTLDGTQPPLGFRQFQTVDLSDWNGRVTAPQWRLLLEGVDRGKGIKAPEKSGVTAASPRFRRMGQVAVGVGALAAAVGTALLLAPSESKAGEPPELEITRMEALTPSLPAEFAGNVRQEIRAALATDNAISVTSDSAGESKARFSLDATMSSGPGELKFAVEVSDRKSGKTLWSRILDIPVDQTQVAPRQLAYKVGQVVRCGLSSESQELDPHSLGLWFRYCDELWGNTKSEDATILNAVQKVTEAAPHFSPAWSARALFSSVIARRSSDQKSMRGEAAAAARRALELNPKNGEAFGAMANLLPDRDYAGREALLRKGVEARPTDCFCEAILYAQFLLSVGRIREAETYYRRVHDLRPLSANGSWGQIYSLFLLGRDKDAQALLIEAREVWPEEFAWMTVRSAFWTGDYDSALAVVDNPKFKVPQPRRESWRTALNALKSGSEAQKRAAVAALAKVARSPEGNNLIGIAALGALGAKSEALQAAERFAGKTGITMMLFEPTFDGVRHTAEFDRLIESLGLARYWATTGKTADFCASDGARSCRRA